MFFVLTFGRRLVLSVGTVFAAVTLPVAWDAPDQRVRHALELVLAARHDSWHGEDREGRAAGISW